MRREHVCSRFSSPRHTSSDSAPRHGCNDEESCRRKRADRNKVKHRAIDDTTMPNRLPCRYLPCNAVYDNTSTIRPPRGLSHTLFSSSSDPSMYSTAIEERCFAGRRCHVVAYESGSSALGKSPRYNRRKWAQRIERWSKSSKHLRWVSVFGSSWRECSELERRRRRVRPLDSSRSTSNPISRRRYPTWLECILRLSCRHWCRVTARWEWISSANWPYETSRIVSQPPKQSGETTEAMTNELLRAFLSRCPAREIECEDSARLPWRNHREVHESFDRSAWFAEHRHEWSRMRYHCRSQQRRALNRTHRLDWLNGRDPWNAGLPRWSTSSTNWLKHYNCRCIVDCSR